MARTIKKSVHGILAVEDSTLYTVPGATRGEVLLGYVTNTHSASVTPSLFVKRPSGDSVVWLQVALPAGHSIYMAAPLVLEAGMVIHGYASVADVLHYIISLSEES